VISSKEERQKRFKKHVLPTLGKKRTDRSVRFAKNLLMYQYVLDEKTRATQFLALPADIFPSFVWFQTGQTSVASNQRTPARTAGLIPVPCFTDISDAASAQMELSPHMIEAQIHATARSMPMPKPECGTLAVAAQVEIPLEGFLGQLVLLNPRVQQLEA